MQNTQYTQDLFLWTGLGCEVGLIKGKRRAPGSCPSDSRAAAIQTIPQLKPHYPCYNYSTITGCTHHPVNFTTKNNKQTLLNSKGLWWQSGNTRASHL